MSETKRPGSGERRKGGGVSYDWCGMSNGTRVRGVAVGISRWMKPLVVDD